MKYNAVIYNDEAITWCETRVHPLAVRDCLLSLAWLENTLPGSDEFGIKLILPRTFSAFLLISFVKYKLILIMLSGGIIVIVME